MPAAFGRLCVETFLTAFICRCKCPAAFGRLCVETTNTPLKRAWAVPAAFGRLCVETKSLCDLQGFDAQPPSGGCVLKHKKLASPPTLKEPAAFGRLCVETFVT